MLIHLWHDEKGLALPLAVIIVVVFTFFGFSALFLVGSQGILGQRSTHRTEALHYGEAGIHYYLWHVNTNMDESWQLRGQLPEPVGDDSYRWSPFSLEKGFYQLEVKEEPGKPLLRTVFATGWLAGQEHLKRTIKVSIAKKTFTQHVYFADSDSYYDGDTKISVAWTTGEKCYGSYHTNDILFIDGTPTFFGPVTYVNSVRGVDNNGPGIFRQGHSRVTAIQFPGTNYELEEKAKENGHYYSGRTRILLKGRHYDVKYYENGQETHKEDVLLPENRVIYIAGGSDGKFTPTSGNLFISGVLSGKLTIGAANEIYITGYDPTTDIWQENVGSLQEPIWEQVAQPTPSASVQGIAYQNTYFSPVTKNGELTGYEANTSGGDDMLGLVANNDIKILGKGWFNERNPRSWNPHYDVAPDDIIIHGALFSINKGFSYEGYQEHGKGVLTLRGSLIQKESKPVSQNSATGYYQDYAHDSRMLYVTPPSFPEPLNTGWGIVNWMVDP